ncbi:MAG: polysaccharide biosynthesis protein [Streptosporangiaceae bacterium]
METVGEIINCMRAVAPAGQSGLDQIVLQRLGELTQSLIAVKEGAAEEHARFLGIGQRGLCLPEAQLSAWLSGATVLVTGGTGCIGSTLMAQVAARGPGRLVSVSRGTTNAWPTQASAEYRQADVRDRDALEALIREVKPDVIFHVAAQREPARAEVEVHRTVSTNILGTRNVLEAAEAAGVRQVVCASTGKALRPYSPDIYTASKRAAEWVASSVAGRGEMLISAGRFTHVLDNSVIYRRLLGWAEDGVIRLHSASIAFYVQSALESAQLLLLAGLGAQRGEFRVYAITDLGWPISLLDVALGVLISTSSATPIYFSGYDPGYEEVSFPGLYDPMTAGDVSPLLNAFEAAAGTPAPCPLVDAFRLEMAASPQPAKLLSALDEICDRTTDSDVVRAGLNEMSWALLDVALQAVPCRVLARAAALSDPHQEVMGADHRRVLEAIRDSAGLTASS